MPIQTRSMTKSVISLILENKSNVKSKPKVKASKVRIQQTVEPQNTFKMQTEVIMKDALTGVATKPSKPSDEIITDSELNAKDIIIHTQVEILTDSELNARGLTTNYSHDFQRKVVPATKICSINGDLSGKWTVAPDGLSVSLSDDFSGKWAVAPDGWYWRACGEKCFYWCSENCYLWFEWFELEKCNLIK
jgi:hypothetical protein